MNATNLPISLPIYLDHAATTPVAAEALEAMLPYFTRHYGNPSALHSVGQAAREAVETSREILADALHASPEEIVFTSGGTESDNMALRGAVEANQTRGRHVLTTPTEHHAVLETLERLQHRGACEVEFLPVDSEGCVDPGDIARMLRSDTTLVSVMHANNEIGTVQPIAAIGALCRERGVLFHTDAVQSFGKIPIDVRAMKIDLLSLSAHKFYGPKGTGALYIRRGTALTPYQDGGEQERGRRGGTLNVPGIVGMGAAAEISLARQEAEQERLTSLHEEFRQALQARIPDVKFNGSRQRRLAMNIHLCIPGIEGEPLLLALDAAGVCASAGSACSAGSTEPSHVLQAIGVPRDLARGALRLTMGRSTTQESMQYTLNILAKAARDLRGLQGSVATN